jgi:GT2 family glycosyltransferase
MPQDRIAMADRPAVSAIVPNWDGRRWLPGCMESLRAQSLTPAEVIVVDNASADGSVNYLRTEHPQVRLLELGANTGFACAANLGLRVARSPLVALINTDVVLEPDWLDRMAAALSRDRRAASVACKMVQLADRRVIYDAGDLLRRDGVSVQRGRRCRDDGTWDVPGEVFGACAGAALYRREAVLEVGGFDERYFAYLEDIDLALALRRAGWRCVYEPATALHAGEGSSHRLAGGHHYYVQRNTVLLVAKTFPARWLPLVAYREVASAWRAARERRLRVHLRGLAAGARLVPDVLRDRHRYASFCDRVAIEEVVPRMPIAGRRAAGHPARAAASWERAAQP